MARCVPSPKRQQLSRSAGSGRQKRKEITTTQFTLITPGPDGWVPQAQAALDELAATRTMLEVEDQFGSARRLTELVLGFPVSGGHATRRAIRAVGRLLCHRLGPSVAAEALTWAGSLPRAVGTSTIETFLEFAEAAPGAYRPWRLDAVPLPLDRVQEIAHNRPEAQALCELWSQSRSRLLDPDPDYRQDRHPVLVEEREPDCDDLAQWLRDFTFESCPGRRDLAELSHDEQRAFVETASNAEIEGLARYEGLFDMDISVVGACLLRSTQATLSNTACPQALRYRVRHPYDTATLELALRAGPGCFERSRVRRMLAEMDGDALQELIASAPIQTLEALRNLELLSPDEFVTGRLQDLDLEDRRICHAALGPSVTLRTINLISELARRHPRSPALAWLFDEAERGTLPPSEARHLIDTGCPVIARAAMRHLPLLDLVPSDRNHAASCGDAWLAACPGLAASERPPLPGHRLNPCSDTEHELASRIWYPEPLLRLDGTSFGQAPGWHVLIPKTVADIRRNAKIMRNCTAQMIEEILEGSVFLVIVHDPHGLRYNVAITKDRARYAVGQVNSWANGGVEPGWIRVAFTRRLNELEECPPWESDTQARRPHTPHRDRRRSQARAARQA